MDETKRKFGLALLRKQLAEKRGGETIEFDLEGVDFSIPAPGFWPDDVKAACRAEDEVAMATALFGGPEGYARFTAAGGRSDDLGILLEAYATAQGIDLGKS